MYIQVRFTDLNSNPIQIEDKINISLNINKIVKYKNDALFSSTYGLLQDYKFLSFAKNIRKNIGKNISLSGKCS